MIKILLKKQFGEIFRAYFYNEKKKTLRSKAATAVFFGLFALLMIGLLGGMFTMFSIVLCAPLANAGFAWLYFLIISAISVVLGTFGSVFTTYSGLYLAKDNDLLLSMPIPVRAILAVRLIGVYLMGAMYAVTAYLPALIVYFVVGSPSFASVLGAVWLMFLVTLFVFLLSVALGFAVAKISVKFKRKSYVAVILSLLFITLYYVVYFKAQKLISALLENVVLYGENVKKAAYPLYLVGRVAEGNGLAFLAITACHLALLALAFFVLSRTFIGIATATASGGKVRYRAKEAHSRSPFRALLSREFARFSSSALYMLNGALGTLILPAAGIFLIVKKETVFTLIAAFFGESDMGALIFAAAFLFLLSMNTVAAPSVSLEGKTLWQLRSLPVGGWDVLLAKLTLHLLLTGVPAVLFLIGALVALRLSFFGALLFFVFIVSAILLSALFDLFAGLIKVNLNWTNEIVPIKQSMAVALALLSPLLYAALGVGLYLLFGRFVGALPFLALFDALTIGLALFVWYQVRGRGVKIFENL